MPRHHRDSSPSVIAPALLLGAALALAGLPGRSAHAQEQGKRVVVNLFTGSGGGAIARQTAAILAEAGYTVIESDEYRGAARKLDARGAAPASVARVAAEIGADIVLFGAVEKVSGVREVTVKVHAGASGAEVAVVRFQTRRRRLSDEETEAARAQLLPALAAMGPGAPAGADAGEGAGEDPGLEMEPDDMTPADGSEPAGSGEAVAQAADTEDVVLTPGARDEDGEDEDEDAAAGAAAGGRPPVHVAGGLSFTSRILRSSAPDGVEGPTYDGPLAPALYLDAEIYPAALGPASMPGYAILSNIGIQARFERVFGLSSEVSYTASGGEEMLLDLDTTQMRIGAGLVYRLFLGEGAGAPVLMLGAGYERFQFEVDKSGLPADATVDLPNVTYTSIDPGVGFRYPVTDAIAVTGRGRLLLVLDSGELEDTAEYGATSSSLGFEVGADVEYRVLPKLAVRAGVRFMDITVGLEGAGTSNVDGLTDYYIGALLTAGYLF